MNFTGLQILGHITKKWRIWEVKEQALLLEYNSLHSPVNSQKSQRVALRRQSPKQSTLCGPAFTKCQENKDVILSNLVCVMKQILTLKGFRAVFS